MVTSLKPAGRSAPTHAKTHGSALTVRCITRCPFLLSNSRKKNSPLPIFLPDKSPRYAPPLSTYVCFPIPSLFIQNRDTFTPISLNLPAKRFKVLKQYLNWIPARWYSSSASTPVIPVVRSKKSKSTLPLHSEVWGHLAAVQAVSIIEMLFIGHTDSIDFKFAF